MALRDSRLSVTQPESKSLYDMVEILAEESKDAVPVVSKVPPEADLRQKMLA